MFKNSLLVLMVLFAFSGCATWQGMKKDASSIWEVITNKSSDAWEVTKETTSDAYDATKDKIQEITK